MTSDDLMHRLRSYFRSRGMNARQVADAADVNWRTANRLLVGDMNLTLDSVRKFEAVVPKDFEAPLDASMPSSPCASEAA
ncbi:helix-turn-helix domain-containing protein [Azospirillum oryzae]|uniref:helix-turn-helix domain-containing protein n=1 Tax=Azospirillum oryzae TaxID=286727 RepID=UPI000A1491CF|nr:helix-turn-helix transcriptional regulator [Azospirillum oryzae]